mgnify:CR=1 FL=1
MASTRLNGLDSPRQIHGGSPLAPRPSAPLAVAPHARIGAAPPKRPGRDPAVTLLRSLANVPANVHRALLNVTELDQRAQAAAKRIDQQAATYLRSVRPGGTADQEALKQLRSEQRTTVALADKKIQVLSEAHDLVDKQVEKLNAEIARYDIAAGIPLGREHEIGASTLGQVWEEPMYCTCGRPSFGDMVGCDNPDCAVEWFHFECVGIHASPTGEWLCNVCSTLAEAKAASAVAAKREKTAAAASAAASSGRGGGPGSRGGRGRGGRPLSGPGSRGGKIRALIGRGGGGARGRGRGHGRGGAGSRGGASGTISKLIKKGLTSQEVCPACRGKHKAHTCGRGRSAMLL